MDALMSKDDNNIDKKRERFVRIAEKRVNKILDYLDTLGKCSNRRNYKYSEKDVAKMFSEIEAKTKEIKILFQNSSRRKNRFKLDY